MKTPVVLIAGFLGSGKTTLIRHILKNTDRKIAVIVNEFGDIGVDTQTIQGENIAVREILEGCICCSLEGELDAAFDEIINTYHPDTILVETTGIAEPDNVVLSINVDNALVRLDCVVTVVDADVQVRFPTLSGSLKAQVANADIILINKTDLVSADELTAVQEQITQVNDRATMLLTLRCQADVDIILSTEIEHRIESAHTHKNDMIALSVEVPVVARSDIEAVIDRLAKVVFRIKGTVSTTSGNVLIDAVAGRVYWESVSVSSNRLVCIAKNLTRDTLKALLAFK